MKVIIQIPCYNEALALPVSVSALPRDVPGCDEVEYLVVDDGSTDDTAQVARQLGVHHVITHSGNRGLAAAFMTGLTAALERGADVIVNTDADNQYCAADIEHLVDPILAGHADMVIGARPIAATADFSIVKKVLQRLGSWVVRVISRTAVEDAPSGFRAFSREAAMRLKVFSRYTYTLETIIQAGHSNMRVVSVPVRTNASIRPSRLVRSIPSYVLRSVVTIVRIFATYRPLVFFWSIALVFGGVGFVSGGRFLYFWTVGQGQGHVQSVILAAACMTLSFIALVIGFLADLVAVNRKLLETVDWRIQHLGERLQPRAHTAVPQRHTPWSKSANQQETTTTSTIRGTRSRDF